MQVKAFLTHTHERGGVNLLGTHIPTCIPGSGPIPAPVTTLCSPHDSFGYSRFTTSLHSQHTHPMPCASRRMTERTVTGSPLSSSAYPLFLLLVQTPFPGAPSAPRPMCEAAATVFAKDSEHTQEPNQVLLGVLGYGSMPHKEVSPFPQCASDCKGELSG